MGVWLAKLLCWLAAVSALQVSQERTDGSLVFDSVRGLLPDRLEVLSRDPADQWRGGDYTFRAGLTDQHPHRRTKRKLKRGDGHVISSFRHVPGRALNVATRVVSNISIRDCAVFCVQVSCKAWSHSNVTNDCRFLRAKGNDIVAVPVVQPGADYYEISPQGLGGALWIIHTSGFDFHILSVQPNQIHSIDDPLAPENVLTDYLEPLPTPPPTTAPTDPPPLTAGPDPPVTSPQPPTSPPPTDAPVHAPDLSYQFDFPLECGTRPTFGLLDNVRLLQPGGLQQVRVVGGAVVAAGIYPWQAQIEVSNQKGYDHLCGGIVISSNLILTAAHCHTTHERYYQVRVAQNDRGATDPDEQIIAVENIYRHSGYRPDVRQGYRNDIAMMKLSFRSGERASLTFGDYVQPLCLPTPNTTLVVGQECQISGWGLTNANQLNTPDNASPLLKGAIISVLDPAICYKAYGERFDERLMVCAGLPDGGVDTCQGDSGGPLSCRDETGQWFAAGIVSHGWECGRAGYPGVYTRTSAYLEFLHRTAAFLTGVPVV